MGKKVTITVMISIILILCLVKLFSKAINETYAVGTTLVDTVMTGASTGTAGACAQGGTGVCATNSYISGDSSTKYHDYRYRGADPNNYVSFNDDLYRIIGVFDDYTHGVVDQYLV